MNRCLGFFTLTLTTVAGLGCGGRESGSRPSSGTAGSDAGAATTVSGGVAGTNVHVGVGGVAGTTASGGAAGKQGSGGAAGKQGSGGAAGKQGFGAAAGVAPVACSSSAEGGGTNSSSDAKAPLLHRAAPACCPAQRGPAPAADVASGTPYTDACSSDSECTDGANGRCFPFEGLVMDAGCSYDECFTDSHCPSLSPCLCRGSPADNTANVCLRVGDCAVDADCGPGGYCSPSPSPPAGIDPGCGSPNYAYYCHTKDDTCINASDCPAASQDPQPVIKRFPICAYDESLHHWGCGESGCYPP